MYKQYTSTAARKPTKPERKVTERDVSSVPPTKRPVICAQARRRGARSGVYKQYTSTAARKPTMPAHK